MIQTHQNFSIQQLFYYAEFYYHQAQVYEAFQCYKQVESNIENIENTEEQNELYFSTLPQLLMLSILMNLEIETEYYQLLCEQISIETNFKYFLIEHSLLNLYLFRKNQFSAQSKLEQILNSKTFAIEEKQSSLVLFLIQSNCFDIENLKLQIPQTEFSFLINEFENTKYQDLLSTIQYKIINLKNSNELIANFNNLNTKSLTKNEKIFLTLRTMRFAIANELKTNEINQYFIELLKNLSAMSSSIWQNNFNIINQDKFKKTKIQITKENRIKINNLYFISSNNKIIIKLLLKLSNYEWNSINILRELLQIDLDQTDINFDYFNEVQNINRKLYELCQVTHIFELQENKIKLNSKIILI